MRVLGYISAALAAIYALAFIIVGPKIWIIVSLAASGLAMARLVVARRAGYVVYRGQRFVYQENRFGFFRALLLIWLLLMLSVALCLVGFGLAYLSPASVSGL